MLYPIASKILWAVTFAFLRYKYRLNSIYKKSKKCLSSEKNYDPYDAEEYDNADDFAEEFGDGDYDEGYDDAYDYWEERD